jgi:hypothetical protein
LHWFDANAFYAEASRVMRPGAVIAVWNYPRPRFVEAAFDGLFLDFYTNVVGPYWPAERRHIEANYATLPPFPPDLAPLESPAFALTLDWTLPQVLGYVSSWSATARYKKANGTDPVPLLAESLGSLWPSADARIRLQMPLGLKAARRVAPQPRR